MTEIPLRDEPPIETYDGLDTVDYGSDEVGAAVGVRPVIVLTAELADIVDRAESLLCEAGHVYQRAGQIVRISELPAEVQRIERGTGHVGHLAHTSSSLVDLLSRLATWQRRDGRAKKLIAVPPPTWIAELLMDRPSWSLPPLRGVITSPTITASGEILDRPGYDRETGLVLLHSGRWPTIPRRPTLDDARRALGELHEVVADFPFVSGAGKSGAVAAMLTLAARTAVQGCVPLVAISACEAGTGKTRLADVVSIIGTGAKAPGISPWADPEEGRKTLLAVAMAGDAVALLDNWPQGRPLGDQALDQAITRESIRGRLLGQTAMVSAPWDALVVVTGNGIVYGGDMVDRVLPVELDAGCEDPRSRTGFRHPDLLDWVARERKRLLVACLTVLRAYYVAGRPSQGVTWGSFEPWSDLVRSALIWAGVNDPCENRAQVRDASDTTREALRVLLQRWHGLWGEEWVTSATISRRLDEGRGSSVQELRDAFDDLLPPHASKASNRSIGKLLLKYKGSIRDRLRIERGEKDADRSYLWRVARVG